MVRTEYSGFYHQQERWADNRLFYRQILELGSSEVCTRDHALRELAFHERFSPEVLHDRLSGHKLVIYSIRSPLWVKTNPKSTLHRPVGDKVLMIDVDIGAELLRLAGQSPYQEEILKRDVVHQLDSENYIRGNVCRKVLHEGNLNGLEDYVKIEFSGQGYTFTLPSHLAAHTFVYTYRVESYLHVDGVAVQCNARVLVPGFASMPKGSPNFRFRQWISAKK